MSCDLKVQEIMDGMMHARDGIISYVIWKKPIPSKNSVSLVRQATVSLSGNGIFQGLFQSIIGLLKIHNFHFNGVRNGLLKMTTHKIKPIWSRKSHLGKSLNISSKSIT